MGWDGARADGDDPGEVRDEPRQGQGSQQLWRCCRPQRGDPGSCPLVPSGRARDVPRLIYGEKRPGTGTPARTGTPASPGAPTGAGIPAGTGLIRRRPLASVPSSNSRGFVLPGTGSPAAPPAPSPGTDTAAGTGTGTAAPGPWPEPAATSAARPKFGGLRICPGVPRSEGRTGCAGPGLGGAPRGAGAAGAGAGLGGGWRRPARRGAAAGRWRWPRCHIALDHGGRRALTRHFPEGAAGAAVTPLRAGGAGPRLGGIPLLLPPSPPPALPRCCSPSFLIAAPHPCPPSLPASLYPQPLLVLPSAPPRCGSGVLWGSVRVTRRDGAQAAAALSRDPLRGVLGTPVLPVWLPQLCWVSQRWGLSRSATPLCPPGWGSCASPGGAPGDASAFTSAPPGLGSPRAWQLWGGHPTGSAPQ